MREEALASNDPLPSATVVVVREGPGNPEVLMVRRHAKSTFGASYVFPGGVVDAQDRPAHSHCDKLTARHADSTLGVSRHGLDYYSAAIREVFEETGLMFARDRRGRWAFSDKSVPAAAIDETRWRLHNNEERWVDVLSQYGLRMACDCLHYCAFWVTPTSERRRFSTRFFVAVLPEGQDVRHDETELTDSCWITAGDALEAADANRIQLIHPTYSTLEDIADCKSVQEIVNWARRRADSGVARLLPAFVEIDGEDRIVMPGEPHYPENGTS